MAQKQPVVWADSGDETVQLATRISPALRKQIKIAAFKNEQQLSEWITEALEAHLKRCLAPTAVKPAATPTR